MREVDDSSWPKICANGLRTGAKTRYIEPSSPWENGHCESFNSKLRDEFLNGELFYSIKNFACWPSAGAFTTTWFYTAPPRYVVENRPWCCSG